MYFRYYEEENVGSVYETKKYINSALKQSWNNYLINFFVVRTGNILDIL